MNKRDYIDWKRNKVSKAHIQYLQEHKKRIENEILYGDIEDFGKYKHLSGQISMLDFILNMEDSFLIYQEDIE